MSPTSLEKSVAAKMRPPSPKGPSGLQRNLIKAGSLVGQDWTAQPNPRSMNGWGVITKPGFNGTQVGAKGRVYRNGKVPFAKQQTVY